MPSFAFPLAVLGFMAAGTSAQGFLGFCSAHGSVLADNFLGMYCNNDNAIVYGYNWTWIDLNFCVGNRYGHLVAWDNGGYSHSCTDCKATPVGKEPNATIALSCSCSDNGGGRPSSTLDLNTVLHDNDGTLGCYGYLGNKTLAGP